jgi:GTP-binding protein HflX
LNDSYLCFGYIFDQGDEWLDLGKRAIVGILKSNPHEHVLFMLQLRELEALTRALGYEIVERFHQTNCRTKANYLIGSGKVEELAEVIREKEVDLVVFYNELTSKQKLNLSLAFNCEVIDRYELTLRIFEEMAADRISKLQIELARTRKLYPFYQLQAATKYSGLDRQPRWAGTGEFAFHSKLKGIQKQIGKLRREISTLASEKSRQIRERRKLGSPLICIAGYYNAGKTSLFNILTGENKLTGDRPFKTLSSKYQRLRSSDSEGPLLIDTIGFVIGLDPALIESFELNLMDMHEADLLLFMIGIDDEPDYIFHKLKFGLHLLQDIGVDSNRTLIVLNKIDLADSESLTKIITRLQSLLDQYDWACISAKNRDGVDELVNKCLTKLKALSIRKAAETTTEPVKAEPVESQMQSAVLADCPEIPNANPTGKLATEGANNCVGEEDEDLEEDFDKPPYS